MAQAHDTVIAGTPAGPHGRRYNPQAVAWVRVAVATWLLILAGIFCSLGHYWGAALAAPAALHLWLAYRLRAGARSQQ